MGSPLRNTRWMPLLMIFTIGGIAGFQYYWLTKAYQREKRTLEMRSHMNFRETVYLLQASKLRLDKPDSTNSKIIIRSTDEKPMRVRMKADNKMAGMVEVLNERLQYQRKAGDSSSTLVLAMPGLPDTTGKDRRVRFRQRDKLMQFLYEAESPQDSVRVQEISSTLGRRLRQQNVSVPFQVARLASSENDTAHNMVTIGFKNPVTYALNLGNTFPYVFQRIQGPVIMSVFLVLFSSISFWVLYRSLLRQRRLADIKNEFISNITHELKTPIATVSVAIEAMRSFNASLDPAKSKEYLDISASELQRLSLLVDKVLKLSMFEKREIELKYESVDLQSMVSEVTTSMRLQFENRQAIIHLETEGHTQFMGDRLNLLSVIFNLVDNALKYSEGAPNITIGMRDAGTKVQLIVADNGIGIPEEYRGGIFEKFFRVPTGNIHNAKGYGLGLSYVAHVVERHHGTIRMEPNSPAGSRFVITLPKQPS